MSHTGHPGDEVGQSGEAQTNARTYIHRTGNSQVGSGQSGQDEDNIVAIIFLNTYDVPEPLLLNTCSS